MTPKMLRTILAMYGTAMKPDAFEYLTPPDLEIIYAAVSAVNNCEMCLSFHMMQLGNPESPTGSYMEKSDIATIAKGGIPSSKKEAAFVEAAKYALAHKGVLLDREKKHLATLGFDSEEKMLEITYA